MLQVEVRGKKLAVEKQGRANRWCCFMAWAARATCGSRRFARSPIASRWCGMTSRAPAAPRIAGPLSIEGWVDDLKAMLDLHGIGKARLVGHSLGTLILQHFAARIRSRSRSSSSSASTGRRRRRVGRRSASASPRCAPRASTRSSRPSSRAASRRTRSAEKPEVVAFVRELLTRQPNEGYARSCEAMAAAVAADVSGDPRPGAADRRPRRRVSPVANSEGLAADLARRAVGRSSSNAATGIRSSSRRPSNAGAARVPLKSSPRTTSMAKIRHIALSVQDPEKTARFYE